MAVLQRAKTAIETLSTVLVIVAASALLWTTYVNRSAQASPAIVEDAEGTIAKAHLTNSTGNGPLAIVEFSDFQCPFCAKHARITVPALKKELTGKIRYIVVNLPLDMHPNAIPAAEAAECAAEQGKYWEMHDLLFERQKDLATADYVAYAKELGLDASRLGACLSTGEKLAKVKADKALAERLGANATPTMFLGRMRTDGSMDLLKRINGAAPLQRVLDEVAKF